MVKGTSCHAITLAICEGSLMDPVQGVKKIECFGVEMLKDIVKVSGKKGLAAMQRSFPHRSCGRIENKTLNLLVEEYCKSMW